MFFALVQPIALITNVCSRQIRPPIYSLKQTKLRRRRVIRYAILYFVLLVVFIALIVGPVVAGKFLKFNMKIPMELLQPTGLNRNDTSAKVTGSCFNNQPCPKFGDGSSDDGSSDALTTDGSDADTTARRFMAF